MAGGESKIRIHACIGCFNGPGPVSLSVKRRVQKEKGYQSANRPIYVSTAAPSRSIPTASTYFRFFLLEEEEGESSVCRP